MAIKIDMEIAFHRIKWPFLLETMKRLGFDSTWVNWISQCISTISFSTLVNGKPYGNFRPRRGIRQGDPLSPFLFLIAIEALSRLLTREESRGNIHGIKMSRGCPTFIHSLFANNLFIFARANDENLLLIFSHLDTYQKWSGQCINRQKSVIFLAKTCPL